MHNWWIASLEHFGLITRAEAEHLAANIKLSIHKDNYKEAFQELEAILGEGNLNNTPIVEKLKGEIADLRHKVEDLGPSKEQIKPLAKANKA
jgi:hypothetical protein